MGIPFSSSGGGSGGRITAVETNSPGSAGAIFIFVTNTNLRL